MMSFSFFFSLLFRLFWAHNHHHLLFPFSASFRSTTTMTTLYARLRASWHIHCDPLSLDLAALSWCYDGWVAETFSIRFLLLSDSSSNGATVCILPSSFPVCMSVCAAAVFVFISQHRLLIPRRYIAQLTSICKTLTIYNICWALRLLKEIIFCFVIREIFLTKSLTCQFRQT